MILLKKEFIKEENGIRYFNNGDFVDISKLPRFKNNVINWVNSSGCIVAFKYGEIEDCFIINEYDAKTRKFIVNYKSELCEMKSYNILECKFGVVLKIVNYDYDFNVGDIIKDDKRDIVITNRYKIKNSQGSNVKMYNYRCNICGYDGFTYETSIKKGCGCKCCSNNISILGINTIWDTDKWMVPIVGEDIAKTHTHGSHEKIYPICPSCGEKKSKKITINDIYYRKSIGCHCNDGYSYIEKYMYSVLEQLKEKLIINKFATQQYFRWCKYYNPYKNKDTYGVYDFVIEDIKLIIETDGGFHREENNMSGQTLEESQWIDNKKDELAKKNGYEVIRISDNGDFKENITNSKLNGIFDLDNIDWDRCINFGMTSLMKIACTYKNNNDTLSPYDISKLMNGISATSIRKWLKIGDSIGLCNYDKNNSHLKCCKSVICLETLDVFDSIVNCCIYFEKTFNIMLNKSSVAKCCNNKQKTAMGYTFKFIKDLTEEECIKYDVERKLEELKKGDVVK